MRGGSYLVARRIRMHIEGWDRDVLSDQQNVFGRSKYTRRAADRHDGARHPELRCRRRRDGSPDDPGATRTSGWPRTRRTTACGSCGADIRSPTACSPDSGELDAGLFFLAFQKDPRTQFVTLQRKLGAHDALNEYIEHVGSGLFACPPGVRDAGDYWGSALFS